ncbi:PaaI family thioesterase [Peterkaempfera griseoplana]|uniref:PaaI family thioesterase n=1 Tax=Peterkaempfera griseoplana TaxID=66896 RepID=UPI0006E333C1|nr:PaaI family thioesterase [Peterkaempfera griseoplana]
MGTRTPTRIPAELQERFRAVGLDLPAVFAAEHLTSSMGMHIVAASPEEVVATLPVAGNTGPDGALHPGACAILAETTGSIGALLYAGPERVALGVDLSTTRHRGVRTGLVTAVATPVGCGSTVATYRIAVTDEEDRRICSARLTCLLRPAPAAGPATSR